MSIRSARSRFMRRGFSVSSKSSIPFKGLGVLVGEVKPNAPSTASEEVNWA